MLHVSVKETVRLKEGDHANNVFFQLFDKVQQLQRSNPSRLPVVVHCL